MSNVATGPEKGLHNRFIKKKLQPRIRHFSTKDIQDLDRARTPGGLAETALPDWLQRAPGHLQQQVRDSQQLSRTSNEALAKTLTGLKGVVEFAQPLLEKALLEKFSLKVDVTQTFLYTMKFDSSTEDQSLLQLALRNFEDGQTFEHKQFIAVRGQRLVVTKNHLLYSRPTVKPGQVYGEHFAWQTGPRDHTTLFQISKLAIDPGKFATLCRELDIGRRYQEHLKAMFEAPDRASTVRTQTIQAWKNSLRAHAHIASLKKLISPSGYATLLAVLDGDNNASLDGEPVTFSQLHILGSSASELFVIGAKRREKKKVHFSLTKPGTNLFELAAFKDSRIIVCIPGDPFTPVKEYATLHDFELELAKRLRFKQNHRAYTRLIPHGEAGKFVSKILDALMFERWNPDLPYTLKGWLWDYEGGYEKVFRDDPSLDISESFFDGPLFDELYTRHQQRLTQSAEQLAVPTAKVDHDGWVERLTHYVTVGLDILNVAAFFIPGLGEVMMAVMAVQLTTDVYHGIEAWSIGDIDQAWGYVKSVATNLAFMAVLGAVASKAPKIGAATSLDGLVNVKLPFGDEQLWRPSLEPYKSDVVLAPQLKPNALGQYEVDGRIYIKIDGNVYEKTFDARLHKWRLKHPTNAQAYHPVLEHNGQGAWRHGFERPLEWDRAALLRRLGHQTEGFDTADLQTIADISGVDEAVLRKMHVDNRPMPSALVDTLHQFRIDRQVHELIDRVRLGRVLPAEDYQRLVPHVVKMRHWPEGRVIEVFEQADLRGPSSRFGEASSPPKSAIRISRAEVAAGKLPERIFGSVEEQEILQLLDWKQTRISTVHEMGLFGQQLADTLSGNKGSLFDSISNELATSGSQSPQLKALQRTFPSLSEGAAQEVLNAATGEEWLHIQQKGRLPSSVLLKARTRARQARLNKALAGMQLESLASLDSQRLALHALEKLPGWPNDVRLELRQGRPDGKLLDAIGSESAEHVRYLVRDGAQHPYPDRVQPFDAQGHALNRVPTRDDSVFDAIMFALPEQTRGRLKLPYVGQGHDLRRILLDYATKHRQQMLDTLVTDTARQRFSPPVRMADGRLGYPLSGRGAGASVNPSLISKVQDVYPVPDAQAEQMIARLLLDGRSESQIVHLLNQRQREFDELCTALMRWMGTAPGNFARLQNVAQGIKSTWQARGLVDSQAASFLGLRGVSSLPELSADFSHVRSLEMDAEALLSRTADYFSSTFPNARRLTVAFMDIPDLTQAAERLASLTQVRELSLIGYGPSYETGAQQLISAMPQLERLSLYGSTSSLDISSMSGLRSLTLVAGQDWPQGLLDLMHLESLDVSRSLTVALPEALFAGHENIWRGLKINWSNLEPEQFLQAFEHVSSHPGHLRDVDEMVENYCRGLLERMLGEDSVFSAGVMRDLLAEGVKGRDLAQRFTQLHREELSLDRHFREWQQSASGTTGQEIVSIQRLDITRKIKECWLAGVRKRYGGERPETVQPSTSLFPPLAPSSPILNLSNSASGALPRLPDLPGTGFSHVRTLYLSGVIAPAEEISGFLQHFPEVRTLDLSGNQLAVIPESIPGLSQLTELNLARNQLVVSPQVQASLNRMTSLERLNLQLNRVGSLDVTSMPELQTLLLSRTAVNELPEGALALRGLRYLDVSRTAITALPAQALTEQYSAIIDVSGCALTPRARTDLLASTSEPRVMGIDRTVLLQGHTGGSPEYYPHLVSQYPELLIQLPQIPTQELVQMPHADRLMRLDPSFSQAEAVERMQALEGDSLVPGDVEAQVAVWEYQHQSLTKALNDWIAHPPRQVGGLSTPTWITALERRRASDQLLACWRQGVRGVDAVENSTGGVTLDFSSTPLGSFPRLAGDFAHVGTLRLNRVYLNEQGLDGLAPAFSHIHTLELDSNQLANLPGAIASFRQLRRLSVVQNSLITTVDLQNQLSALTELESLNLARNELSALDITTLPNLRELNLHHNSLEGWPAGALESTALRTLNVSNNLITTVPTELFSREPGELVRGINITDNSLNDDELNELGSFLERTGLGLGYTHESLDRALQEYEREFGDSVHSSGEDSEYNSGSDTDSSDGNDVAPVLDITGNEARRVWIDSTSVVANELNGIWSEFAQTPGSSAFFKVLHHLPRTSEFMSQPANLIQRVQEVLRAAHEDPSLSATLFEIARVPDTCGDGYALVFSDMELKVFETGILKAAPGQDRASVLFRLGRTQFRIDKLESIARDFIKVRRQQGKRLDQVEVRLAFRINLAERLDLPGQSPSMLYEHISQVTPEMIEQAYAQVLAAEQSADFIDALVQRSYWSDLLKQENPQRFAEIERERDAELDDLSDQHPDFDEAYLNATTELGLRTEERKIQVLIEMSLAKVAQLKT